MDRFDPEKINPILLLHATIARGKFIKSHEYFSGLKGANYFEYAGSKLAEILLTHRGALDIWIP